VFRVGILRQTSAPASQQVLAATGIPKALAGLGYVEDRNLVIEARWADGDVERLPALARDLVQPRVDVVIAVTVSSARAAVRASSTVPMVFFGIFDPVASGLVPNLARPQEARTAPIRSAEQHPRRIPRATGGSGYPAATAGTGELSEVL